MRDIEGFEETIEMLVPHWDQIQEHFDHVNRTFISLSSREHDTIGRVLRAHLVIEHFLNLFLENHYGHEEVAEMRLSFHSKSLMLPKTGSSASFVRSGIIELNIIRNKFAHRLDYEIKQKDLTAMIEVLRYARSTEAFEGPLDVIEGFLPVAAAWLAVAPKHLQSVFDDAFAKLRLQTPKIIEEMKEKQRSRQQAES